MMLRLISKFALSALLAIALWCGVVLPSVAQVSDGEQSAVAVEAAPAEDLESLSDLRDKAFTATNAGDFAAAEGYWSKILQQRPDNPAVWSNRGNSRVSQNKLDEAIADYAKAIELAPDAPDPYLNRGAALEGVGRWDEAIADYDRVLELDPNDPAAYNNRGNAKGGRGDWEGAIADFKKASELAPDFAFAYGNYAIALYQ
ncbi:MAG TPA: tetratricopeptide repeat protein, partial [Chroococcidiopsis sp.]